MYLFTGTTTIYIFTNVLIQDAYEIPLKNVPESFELLNFSETQSEKNCH